MQMQEIRVTYGHPISTDPPSLDLKNPADVARLMAPLMALEVVEVCYVVLLTTKIRALGYQLLSRGDISSTPVQPREVFQAALMVNAASVVLVHNHPSGDPTPSASDVLITRRVKEAGELIGVELLDHIIVGHNGRFTSLREQRVL